MVQKLQFVLINFIILILLCTTASLKAEPNHSPVISMLSISSDGRYVISSHYNRRFVLWDLQTHTNKIVSNNANIYSANWIKHTPYFIWQDLKNVVHVDDIQGHEKLSFKNFPVYGQIISSDLKQYYASSPTWDIYKGYGKNQKLISKGVLSFYGIGKLMNLNLSNDGKYLLTSGSSGAYKENIPIDKPGGLFNLDGVVLWNAVTGKPIKKLQGNIVKTFATLSPLARYIVAGDEDSHVFVWDTKSLFQKLQLWDIYFGKWLGGKNLYDTRSDKTGLIKMPDDFVDFMGKSSEYVYALKFIDNDHYLRFTTNIPYAILYKVTDPKPLKYFPLGKNPMPVLMDYVQDESVDTAPKAHVLVMSSTTDGGIIEYKYDPKKQTLKKIWVGYLKPKHSKVVQWFLDL